MKLFTGISAMMADHPFLDNKYTKWYYAIIDIARRRQIEGYQEKHHIIPDCFFIDNRSKGARPGWLPGDSNNPINLVNLTAKEHFICHWLLTKMVSGRSYYQMERALWMLSFNSFGRPRICNSGHYSRAKVAASLYKQNCSSPKKNKKYGKQKNPFTGQRICSNRGKSIPEEVRQKISQSLKGRPSPRKGIYGSPSPKLGRVYGPQKNPAEKIQCPHCPKMIRSNNLKRHVLKCALDKVARYTCK